ncbi:unnamed protein product [Fraxinus pennsylvanica]|uniref:Uncharacterized protein n=1 Tax=Fraxinus pennsylvanica TaxID=56036 RepID=A0AAD2AE13_9LAMI|nr:unnamed protein product [Fraxinus pennsylvanica]
MSENEEGGDEEHGGGDDSINNSSDGTEISSAENPSITQRLDDVLVEDEVGMLARCLCMPLVSIRVGKITKQGSLLCSTPIRSNRDLLNMEKKRTCVIHIIENARHLAKYRMLVSLIRLCATLLPQSSYSRPLPTYNDGFRLRKPQSRGLTNDSHLGEQDTTTAIRVAESICILRHINFSKSVPVAAKKNHFWTHRIIIQWWNQNPLETLYLRWRADLLVNTMRLLTLKDPCPSVCQHCLITNLPKRLAMSVTRHHFNHYLSNNSFCSGSAKEMQRVRLFDVLGKQTKNLRASSVE